MHILITGATGYLGGNLALHLAASKRHDLRFTTRGEPSALPIELRTAGECVSWIPGDEDSCRAAVAGMDAIIHLAAPNEIDSARNPALALEHTVLPTQHLMAAARETGAVRLLFLSTVHVYGAPLAGTLHEETPTAPAHPYALAHRAAEEHVLSPSADTSVTGLVLRLTNAVGAPGLPISNRWSLLVNDICRQAVEQGQIRLRSLGQDWRDFVPMRDALAAITRLLECEKPEHRVYNIASGTCCKVMDVAELVARQAAAIFGQEVGIKVPDLPVPTEMPRPFRVTIDRLLESGFQPTSSIEKAVDDTLRYCSRHFTTHTS